MEALNIRQRTEEFEERFAPFASKSRLSRGRVRFEDPCPIRTVFQRDRDRIIYCNAFRRLKHKTQVFVAPLGDHYVTRLTHTLEVSQIARTISRALNINEDLTEAISLGHDLGHTPFGHIGEEILNDLFFGGFHHNEQSLRIVDLLEKDGKGLNLTWEVRNGILHHSKSYINNILGEGWNEVATLEGEVVRMADLVAYINHDVDDAIRAGVITDKDLPDSVSRVLGENVSQRINTLVTDIVVSTLNSVNGGDKKPTIKMSEKVLAVAGELREFLFARVYNSKLAENDRVRARDVLHLLFSYFAKHPEKLSKEYTREEDPVERRVTDYIAGMTDQYALNLAATIRTSPDSLN
jgi:dGTPase